MLKQQCSLCETVRLLSNRVQQGSSFWTAFCWLLAVDTSVSESLRPAMEQPRSGPLERTQVSEAAEGYRTAEQRIRRRQ